MPTHGAVDGVVLTTPLIGADQTQATRGLPGSTGPMFRITWQCEKKAALEVSASWSVDELKAAICNQIAKDYAIDTSEEEVDADIFYQGRHLYDDSWTLAQIGMQPNSNLIVLSETVAQVRAEEGNIRQVSEAFKEIFDSGDFSPEAEKEALRNARPFPVCASNTMSLGELGPGWPLVFYFIGFVSFSLFMIYILYWPATLEYYDADESLLAMWPVDGNKTLSFRMGSAGNLGPDKSRSITAPWCALGVAIFIVLGVLLFEIFSKYVKRVVDSNEVDPNDFAIFVQGLPLEPTPDEKIKKFFEANAREGENTPVAKVVVAYDVHFFQKEKETLAALKAEMATCTDPRQMADLKDRYAKWNKLYGTKDFPNTVPGTGCAIVIFQYQKHQRECIQQWQSCLPSLLLDLGCSCGSSKPAFKDEKGEEYTLRVERAENPDDILWENLGVPLAERWKIAIKANSLLVLVFFVGFGFIYGAQKVKHILKLHFPGMSWAASLTVVLIAISNFADVQCSRKALAKEIHQTKTQQDVSYMRKLAILYTLNYSLVLFAVNLPPGELWYNKSGLVMDIFTLETMNALIYPFFLYVNFAGFIKRKIAWIYTSSDAIPRLIRKCQFGALEGEGSNEDKTYLAMLCPNQAALNKFHELPTLGTPRVYAQVLKAFFLGLLYLPLVPMGTLSTAIGLFMYFWALKYQLLRNCKRPYRQSAVLVNAAVQFIEIGVVAFGFSQWIFLSQSLDGAGQAYSNYVMFLIMACGVGSLITPPDLVGGICDCFCKKDTYTDVDYYTAQHAWPKSQKYHTTHEVYLHQEIISTIMAQKFKDKFKMPWDPRTGNLPDPVAPPQATAPPAPTDPAPGKVTSDEPLPVASTASTASTQSEPDVAEAVDHGEDPEDTTGPIAASDPAKLALEAMKYKIPVDMMGGSKDGKVDVVEALEEEEADDAEESLEAPLVSNFETGCQAGVKGLTSAAGQKFNDTSCTILSVDRNARKCLVMMEDGTTKCNVPFQNLEFEASAFAPGQKVRVYDLQKAKQFNDTVATVISWNEAASKYTVQLCSGAKANIPATNLEAKAT